MAAAPASTIRRSSIFDTDGQGIASLTFVGDTRPAGRHADLLVDTAPLVVLIGLPDGTHHQRIPERRQHGNNFAWNVETLHRQRRHEPDPGGAVYQQTPACRRDSSAERMSRSSPATKTPASVIFNTDTQNCARHLRHDPMIRSATSELTTQPGDQFYPQPVFRHQPMDLTRDPRDRLRWSTASSPSPTHMSPPPPAITV